MKLDKIENAIDQLTEEMEDLQFQMVEAEGDEYLELEEQMREFQIKLERLEQAKEVCLLENSLESYSDYE